MQRLITGKIDSMDVKTETMEYDFIFASDGIAGGVARDRALLFSLKMKEIAVKSGVQIAMGVVDGSVHHVSSSHRVNAAAFITSLTREVIWCSTCRPKPCH